MDDDEKSNITIGLGSNLTLPNSGKVTVKNALVLESGGKVVGRLDATYDFSELDPKYHMTAASMINRRHTLVMQTDAALARGARRDEEYQRRKKEFDALPWYKQLFAKRPWEFDIEE